MNTIRAFLSRTRSRGPFEVPRPHTEFTTYTAADLDVKFLLALAKEPSMRKLVCVPDFVACVSNGLEPIDVQYIHKSRSGSCRRPLKVRAGVLAVNARSSPRLLAPADLRALLDACAARARFAVCNFGVYQTDTLSDGHSNALVFNLREKVIERFEPSGQHAGHRKLDGALRRQLASLLPGWTYRGTATSAPRKGPQERADAFDGLCVTYSLFYVLLRVLNPDRSSREIQAWMVERPPGEIRDDALRLNRFAIEKLKRIEQDTLIRSRTTRNARGARGRRSACSQARTQRSARRTRR